jgi:hypothetical protein
MDETLYREASTFKNLVCLNIAFLKGIITETPYHVGPIDNETIPLLSQLIQLNKKGFLSTSGQPGIISDFISPIDGIYYQENQKSFIRGYIYKSLSEKLQMFIQDKPFYMVIVNNKSTEYDSIPVDKYNLTRDINLEDPNEPSDDHTNVLKNRYLPYTDFKNYKVNSLLKKEYVLVQVYSKVYGEGYSAEQLIFDFFNSLSDVVEIDTEFNTNLSSLDDKLLYIIAVKDSNILNEKEFDIVKEIVFLKTCDQIKNLRNSELKLLFKKLINLNIKLRLIK